DEALPEVSHQLDRVIVTAGYIRMMLKDANEKKGLIEIPWTPKVKGAAEMIAPLKATTDEKLVRAIVRAHVWLADLSSGRHSSVDALAEAAQLHPKVVRQGLRL